MTDFNSFNDMTNFEAEAMLILLTSKATKSALTIEEFINLARLQGATDAAIKKELLADLEEGGRLFGEFRNAIAATSNGVIARMRDSAQFAEDLDVQDYLWVAVLSNSCPDCVERHGQIKTMDEWEQEGLPRAGFTVCKEHCQCILVDASKSVLKPIVRGTRLRSAKERVLTT